MRDDAGASSRSKRDRVRHRLGAFEQIPALVHQIAQPLHPCAVDQHPGEFAGLIREIDARERIEQTLEGIVEFQSVE